MAVFINGKGNISPQQTWGDSTLLSNPRDYSGSRLECVQPDYSQFVDVRQLRRMSRIIKMGVASGTLALREAGIAVPDGIITGTGYGCLEDTGTFLAKMIEANENALNPTPFIQSTHNTIGSQIALLLQCQGYNQTYTQRAFSFENVLLDSILELNDNPGQSILAGGVDEITDASHAILKRFGLYRNRSVSSLALFKEDQDGTLQGEGAAYFVLSGIKSSHCKVCVQAVATFFKPGQQMKGMIETFLASSGMKSSDIDLLLTGKSGNKKSDHDAASISSTLFSSSSSGLFKHLCGEHPSASAFAVWLGSRIIEEQYIPEVVIERDTTRAVKNCLIYNPYFSDYHSLILLSAC